MLSRLARTAMGVLALTLGVAGAQEAAPAGDAPPLSIGFLPDGSDFVNQPLLVERLREALLARPAVVTGLVDAGYAPQLELSPCDGARDMVQRMDQQEFDVVLATAVVYGRSEGNYVPILQTHRRGDFQTQAGWLRRGVIIAGPESPFYDTEAMESERVAQALREAPLAVPGADSAAGYIYPTLKLFDQYSVMRPGRYWFCGSDAEVVKHVVAGLAPLGACREGVLETLLPEGDEKGYYRVLARTDQFPTDPILIRRMLAPERSALGAELKVAMREFFASAESERIAPGLEIANATARTYEKIARDLSILEALNRYSRPEPLEQARPRPTPETLTPPGGPAEPMRREDAATTGQEAGEVITTIAGPTTPTQAVELPDATGEAEGTRETTRPAVRPVLPGLPGLGGGNGE